MIIRDAETNRSAVTGADGHLHTAARTIAIDAAEAHEGNSFNFNTGTITLTNAATANGMAYIKNTTTAEVWVITAMFYLFGNSTSGTGDALMEVLRNPSTGTLIDTTPVTQAPVNRDFSSAKTLSGDFFKAGASGDTLTDGDVVIESLFSNPTGRQTLGVGAIVIKPGNSIGWRYTTQTSNSSQGVQVACAIYKHQFDI